MKIEQDKQFPATTSNVERILACYELKLVNFSAAKRGIENTTLIVEGDTGKVVLRVYRQHKKSDEHINQEVEFMIYLRNHGVSIPALLRNSRGALLTKIVIDGVEWQAVLMEFVEGYNDDGKHTDAMLQDMAQIQATMHILTDEFHSKHQGFVLNELKESQFIKGIDFNKLSDSRLISFLGRAEKYHLKLSEDLPRGYCHLDYDKGNILFDTNGKITAILDFDDLAITPYVVDLAYTLWYVQYQNDAETADKYQTVYEKTRQLSNQERSILQQVVLFRHYVICSLNVLDGAVDSEAVNKYLDIEEAILQRFLF